MFPLDGIYPNASAGHSINRTLRIQRAVPAAGREYASYINDGRRRLLDHLSQKTMRIQTICLFLFIALLAFSTHAFSTEDKAKVVMDVFWGETCPLCIEQQPFLSELESRYPQLQIRQYEVFRNRSNLRLFALTAYKHGIEAEAVPTIFIAGNVFIGDAPFIRKQLEETVRDAILKQDRQLDAPEADHERIQPDIKPETEPLPEKPAGIEALSGMTTLSVPLLGTIDLTRQPLIFTTLLISFVDGFNPCSLWVLTLLLGMVLRSGSRKRMLMVGCIFLFTTATIYGVFIAGIFKVLSYIAYLAWVQWLVALFALGFGLVNIKDFFWFKRGFSFTISDQHKPGIYQSIRKLLRPEITGLSLAGATFVMASGIAFVELPCTAGFPVIWSQLVKSQQVGLMEFYGLLIIYLFIYLLIEIIIFLTAVLTLKRQWFEERHGQVLKLIGGMIMVALGIVMLVNPDLMYNLTDTLLVFSAALLAAGAVALLKKWTTGALYTVPPAESMQQESPGADKKTHRE